MPHEVESLAYVQRNERDVPWHGLGIPVDATMTSAQAMAAAGLDWTVECRRVSTERGDGSFAVHDGQVAVTRVLDDRVYQIAPESYRPVQPEECFAFFDQLIDPAAKYDTVGSLRAGAVVFLAAKLERQVVVGGRDLIDVYLVLRNSYDSTFAFGVDITPIRPVCMNTVTLAIARAERSWTMRYAGSPERYLDQARRTLDLADGYVVALEEDLNLLADQSFFAGEFEQFASRALRFGELMPPGSVKQEVEALVTLFETSPTLPDELRYTKYGALQAIIEHLDWGRPVGAAGEGDSETRAVHALGWSGSKPAVLRRVRRELDRVPLRGASTLMAEQPPIPESDIFQPSAGFGPSRSTASKGRTGQPSVSKI